jgi:triosephosphate isomerase (TIM)
MAKIKRKIYIIGNWKMNPSTGKEAKAIFDETNRLASKSKKVTVVACAPYPFISLFKSTKPALKLGAQDVFFEQEGAFTSQVSADQLLSLGAGYVILGHSEKRAQGDTDEIVAKKARVALEKGMKVVVCIGELARDGHGHYLSFIKDQIFSVFKDIPKKSLPNVIVAYEPVWSIGKRYEDTMKPPDIHQTSLYLRKIFAQIYGKDDAMKIPVLYGGSVNFENAGPILSDGEVSGFLLGRQSIDMEGLSKIINYANKL